MKTYLLTLRTIDNRPLMRRTIRAQNIPNARIKFHKIATKLNLTAPGSWTEAQKLHLPPINKLTN